MLLNITTPRLSSMSVVGSEVEEQVNIAYDAIHIERKTGRKFVAIALSFLSIKNTNQLHRSAYPQRIECYFFRVRIDLTCVSPHLALEQ